MDVVPEDGFVRGAVAAAAHVKVEEFRQGPVGGVPDEGPQHRPRLVPLVVPHRVRVGVLDPVLAQRRTNWLPLELVPSSIVAALLLPLLPTCVLPSGLAVCFDKPGSVAGRNANHSLVDS